MELYPVWVILCHSPFQPGATSSSHISLLYLERVVTGSIISFVSFDTTSSSAKFSQNAVICMDFESNLTILLVLRVIGMEYLSFGSVLLLITIWGVLLDKKTPLRIPYFPLVCRKTPLLVPKPLRSCWPPHAAFRPPNVLMCSSYMWWWKFLGMLSSDLIFNWVAPSGSPPSGDSSVFVEGLIVRT